jgi:cation:H+ antiporter
MSEVVVTQYVIDIIVIAISFVFLNWTSNIVISYALKVSAISKLGKTSVGFTLISLSTTLPELTVALIAALEGGAPLSIGNVLGSNIFNISVVLGLGIVILTLTKIIKRTSSNANGTNLILSFPQAQLGSLEFGLFISSIIPLILIYVSTGAAWVVGLILLVIFFAYMYKLAKVRMPDEEEATVEEDRSKLKRYIIYTIAGALGIVISANFLVDSAINIATAAGISQQVIGATIIAVGTSLPELTIGVKAILKGHPNLALGNIIGASFFNTTLILGITFFVPALVGTPLDLNMNIFQNLVVFSIITNLFFWYFISRKELGWREGVMFLFMYVLFVITTISSL